MNTEQIIKYLIEEKQYDRIQTERLAPKIDALPEDIREALENWVENGSLESPEYEGMNVEAILKLQPRMKTVTAFLTLDWLRRDPQNALKSLRQPFIQRNWIRKEGNGDVKH